MDGKADDRRAPTTPSRSATRSSQSIEWYHDGQARSVTVDGVRVTVRLVERRGRRGRIAIVAPPGALFEAEEPRTSSAPGDSDVNSQ